MDTDVITALVLLIVAGFILITARSLPKEEKE